MPEKPKVATCLWYDGRAQEAVDLYVSLIPGSAQTSEFRLEPEGTGGLIEFTLAGAPYQALNGGPQFTHSEAASISVLTEDQAETDRLWEALTAEGGAPSRCGWLKDRFGISWQIVPKVLPEMFSSPDREAAGRATAAMMEMGKLEIAALEVAFRGA